MHILRLPEVIGRTGLSRTTLWRLERNGQFPRRIYLSRNSVGWDRDEVSRWLANRPRGLSVSASPGKAVLGATEEKLQ
jgi:prophage regulatory protein